MPETIRVQKYLSDCGFASRRKAEELIRENRVYINKTPAGLGDGIVPGRDRVFVDGKEIVRTNQKIYLMLNKPRGFITSLRDEKGRDVVTSLLTGVEQRVYPVGRLDYNSEGLLLFTNDGELANRLTHPRYEVQKTYLVVLSGVLSDAQVDRLRKPVLLDDGKVQPVSVSVAEKRPNATVLSITVKEGKNREIRKICEANGLLIRKLKRVAEGGVELGDLQSGKWRYLSKAEEQTLKSACRNADGELT
jgi:23S rRNA pseudouridine2605 synthase